MTNILIADDEELIRDMYHLSLSKEGYNIYEYDPVKDNGDIFEREYDVALLDIVMPKINGFELREKLIENSPQMETIFISGNQTHEIAERVIEEGGHSFLVKPASSEQIRTSVHAAVHFVNLKKKKLKKKENKNDKKCENGRVCICYQKSNVRSQIKAYAPLDIPILISGESGTGKEIVANCIHSHSKRSGKRMVSLNCAALSPSLIESELFGHVKGAFTGAASNKDGYFRAAEGSTLFLDEIGELPLDLQAKLLRVLDSHEVIPVGSTAPHSVDVRIISATNRDLLSMIKKGEFRSDLYYRLHGTNISLKPLKSEPERIGEIARSFIQENGPELTEEAENYLKSLTWSGNIRELKAVVEVLAATCHGEITESDVKSICSTDKKTHFSNPDILTYNDFKEDVLLPREKEYFKDILKKTRGNISEAARLTGVSRKHLYDKLGKMGLI